MRRSKISLLIAIKVCYCNLASLLDVGHLLNEIVEVGLIILEDALLYFLCHTVHLHLVSNFGKEVVVTFRALLVLHIEHFVKHLLIMYAFLTFCAKIRVSQAS